MGKNCLEAFSDGVIAMMVLELKVPHDPDFRVPIPLALAHSSSARRTIKTIWTRAGTHELYA